ATGQTLEIYRGTTILDQLQGLTDGINVELPTLQDLVDELQDRLGIDLGEHVELEGDLSDPTLVIDLDFALEPYEFTQSLDFGSLVPSLSLDASADFPLTVTPTFHLPLGFRLGPDVAAADRFFLESDDEPEISLHTVVTFDPQAH